MLPYLHKLIASALSFLLGLGAALSAQEPPDMNKVKAALEKYQDPVVAVHDGYFSTLGCVEYPMPGGPGQAPYQAGGMGVHFFNLNIQGLDAMRPNVLIYEPDANQKLRLVAAEWFVPVTPQTKERPTLFGKPFDGPMEGHHPLMPVGLHHYDLHVWLWKDNPSGMFKPTNPSVKCGSYPYSFRETAPKLVSPTTH